MNTIHLLLSDSHGIYIPKKFAEFENWEGITQEQKEILNNPENEFYWETWEEVLITVYYVVEQTTPANLSHIIKPGKWSLYQTGDLFAVHETHNFENEG